MNTKKTGAFIATLRKEKGLTQQALAEQLFVTAKTVSRWETGSYAPPVDIIARLSEILGTTADEIIAGERKSADSAETVVKSAQKQSSFDLEEKISFYRKKWLREHIALCVILAIVIIAAIAVTISVRLYWAAGIAFLGGAAAYLIIRNRMMAYIERNAYDGSGNDSLK